MRYAHDSNIYVRSERAGQRVRESVKRFITEKLKLKVNESKSAVAKPQERKFLGFSFTSGKELKRKIAPKAIDRFKERVREITADDGGTGPVSAGRFLETVENRSQAVCGTGTRGVSRESAAKTASSRLGRWHVSQSPALTQALSNRTAVYGPVRTVVWDGRRSDLPPIPI